MEDLSRYTFKALLQTIAPKVKQQVDFSLPSWPMIDACRAEDFDFFLPWLETGRLTPEQMHHAAARYLLGKTKSGQPIFWMVDDILRPLDARIGHTWMSALLKEREPLLQNWRVDHCLFGLHLLSHPDDSCYSCNSCSAQTTHPCHPHHPCSVPTDDSCYSCHSCSKQTSLPCSRNNSVVSIVESESSAVVLSELFPESLWLAYVSATHLSPDLFAPLQGRTVVLYPRTDPSLSTYLFFNDLAALIRQQYPSINLTVDSILEEHATAEQKDRCIDLLDFLYEGEHESL